LETITLKVDGMSCDHCARSVRTALEGVEGVIHAEVDLTRAAAVVSLDPLTADMARLRGAVDEAGYSLAGTST
jgi:copper chaperone CopZ